MAVTCVLLFHLGIISGGFVGVDVFLVISGYLITGLLEREIKDGRFSFLEFYSRRARRIFPALFVTILGCLLYSAFGFSPEYTKATASSAGAALLSVSNIYFWLGSGYFDLQAIYKPLLHTWSLGVEEQFYLFWPAVLLAVIKWRSSWVWMVVGLLSAGSFAANISFSEHKEALYFLTPFRIFEFGIGALVVPLERRLPTNAGVSNCCVVLGLFLICISAVQLTKLSVFPSYNALAPCIGAALVIYGGRSLAAFILRSPAVVWVGLRSYSIYLVHWPIIVFFSFGRAEALTLTQKAFLIAAAVALSDLMYRLIESPFRAGGAPGWRIQNGSSVLASAAVLNFTVTVVLWASNGWDSRLPEGLRHIRQHLVVEQRGFFDLDEKTPFDANKTKVFVFGNSFAADVYRGLEAHGELSVRGSARSHYECYGFVLSLSNRDCLAQNVGLIDHSLAVDADVIVLSEYWQTAFLPEKYALGLEKFISEVRHINPTASIVLVGPRMTYNGKVVDRLLQTLSLENADARMSQFYSAPLSFFKTYDVAMKEWAVTHDIFYISLIDTMCRPDCPVLTPNGDLIFVDDGHFSLAGSRHVGQLIWSTFKKSVPGLSETSTVTR